MLRTSGLAALITAGCLTSSIFAVDSALSDLFSQLDANRDGQLTADEIPAGQVPFFERVLRLGDNDKDQILTRDEFFSALNEPEPSASSAVPSPGAGRGLGVAPPRDGGRLFDQLDRNGDGKLTADEFPEFLRERGSELLAKAGKSELTRDEFLAGMRRQRPGMSSGGPGLSPQAERLREFDRNGDGKLSRDEIPEGVRERLAPIFDRLGTDEIELQRLQEFARTREAGPGSPRTDGNMRPDRNGPQNGLPPREEGMRGPGGQRPDGDFRQGRFGRPEGERGQNPRVPPFVAILDANGDQRVTKDELVNITVVFDQLDRNGDGELDYAELLGPGPREGLGRGPMEQGPMGRGERMGSGRPEEGPPSPMGPDGEGMRRRFDPSQLFSRLDGDGDGFLSQEELPERMRDSFSRMDTDSDGKISLDEMRTGMEAFLRQRFEGERGFGPPGGTDRRDSGSDSTRPQRPE